MLVIGKIMLRLFAGSGCGYIDNRRINEVNACDFS